MIRIATLAAIAAFTAAPAFAADSIRIPTAGKSVEQVQAEVVVAARKLCAREFAGASFPITGLQDCQKHTVSTTLAQARDPAFKLAAK